jgi:hypothetical protein
MKSRILRWMPGTTMTLLLALGAAVANAQETTVKMWFSGTSAPSAINLLQPNTSNDEDNLAGEGTLGSFTFRNVRAISNSPGSSSDCSGPNVLFLPDLAGGGVMRFRDGSLLNVQLKDGGDCISLVAPVAHCSLTLRIAGGTGRFKNASGTLKYTERAVIVLSDASTNPVLFDATGALTGTVSGVSVEQVQTETKAAGDR